VPTATSYVVPPATGVANVKPPFDVIVRLSPPLSVRTTLVLPASPETCPPIVKALVEQSTTTSFTLAPAMTPIPPVTPHVWGGFDGWIPTATEYIWPVMKDAGSAKDPFEVMVREPALVFNTSPPPARLLTWPLTV
jgi:hypothetical protein